jgi:hypothetical protein
LPRSSARTDVELHALPDDLLSGILYSHPSASQSGKLRTKAREREKDVPSTAADSAFRGL